MSISKLECVECFHLVVISGQELAVQFFSLSSVLVWQYLTPGSQTKGTAEQQTAFPSYKGS